MTRARIALAVLLLLAFGVVTPFAATAKKPAGNKPASAVSDSDVVLVRVGKDVITRRTLNDRLQEIPEQYRTNYQSPEGRQQLLQRLVEERVWMMDAENHGVPTRPDIQRQLVSARRDLLIRTWVNEQMTAAPAPSDSEAQAYYDAHLDEFRAPANVAMRHIQLKTEAEARKVLLLARAKGADWNKLTLQYSTDSLTRANGGNLGTVTKDGNFAAIGAQPALAESALAMAEGAIAGPFRTPKGWSVIKVDTHHDATTRTLDQVRSFITRTLGQQRQGEYYQEQLGKARERIGVSPDSAAIKNYMSAKKTARELFQDAQTAGAPQLKIDGYRKVVEQYPDADIAPQAQFMVGFVNSEELKNFDEAEKAFRQLLARYPKSELVASAQWMVDHMRSEESPSFPGADSLAAAPAMGKGAKR